MTQPLVLVADDEPTVREGLGRYLEQEGFRVCGVEDGEAALEVIENDGADLVVLDLMLPRLDGFEVFRRIRADHSTPVIMLTARGDEIDRIVGADLGGAADARMTRVLQNLLMNAVRHTPADGAVSVLAKRDGDRIEVAVEDSGDGLAEADLERIFEPFYRTDPARSGLGLALAKRIVEGVGGRIDAETRIESGARFAVLLPVQ